MHAAKSQKQSRRGAKILGMILGALIVVCGGLYLAGYFMAGDKVPRNVSVLGVPIGGMSAQQAEETLRTELAERAERPIDVVVGEDTVTVQPDEAGLGIDYGATVQAAGVGKSWNPVHIWQVMTGGQPMDPVLAIDEAKLEATGKAVSQELAVEAVDATVSYKDAKVATTPGVQARSIDAGEVSDLLASSYPMSTRVAPNATVTDPAITTEEASRVVKEYAEPAISGPIVVKTSDGKSFQITPAQIAAVVTFTPDGTTLTPKVDGKKLHAGLQKTIDKLGLAKAKDASWKLEGNKPVVVPAVDGVTITEPNLTKVVVPAIPKTGDARTVTVTASKQKAEFTTEMAEKAKPSKAIGTFTTNFPHADYRNVNLGQVAKRINGYVLRPGETFSMNDVVGERTAANGFVDGYVIQGGRLKKEPGGGVSQGATTIFNAAFFAGLEDVEHHPHTLYFPRYPAGREATVYYGSLDLKFKNNTDHGVIVTASRKASAPGSQGSITVTIWGTSPWDEIRSPDPVKSDYYDGRTIEDDSPGCEPQAPSPGFTATYYRAFIKGGKEAKRENFQWKYSATDQIICK